MNLKSTFLVSFYSLLCLSMSDCKKDPIETDPAKAILGKWEITEMGNWPDVRPVSIPNGYKEFLPDSIMREYEYETGEYYYKKYWIDSLLHVYVIREDGYKLFFRYKYNFYDNKLRLDYANILAQFNTFIYKRIK